MLFILSACQSNKEGSNSANQETNFADSLNNIQIDTSQASAIIKELYYKNPEYISIKYIDKKPIIICALLDGSGIYGNSTINVIENFANNWQETKHVTIEYGHDIQNFEWITVQKKELLYFDYVVPGGSMGNGEVDFGLYDYTINKYYNLQFSGMFRNGDKQIDGGFNNIDSLKDVPEILQALEFKASKSDIIYRPSNEDLNIDNPKNAVKKFLLDNPNLHEDLKIRRGYYQDFKITKYSGEATKFFHDYLSSPECEISNDKYSVYSLLKSYVICFDKNGNYYFIVWIPFTTYDWVTKMDLTPENILTLNDRWNNTPEFVIDLNELKIKCISSKDYH